MSAPTFIGKQFSPDLDCNISIAKIAGTKDTTVLAIVFFAKDGVTDLGSIDIELYNSDLVYLIEKGQIFNFMAEQFLDVQQKFKDTVIEENPLCLN